MILSLLLVVLELILLQIFKVSKHLENREGGIKDTIISANPESGWSFQ